MKDRAGAVGATGVHTLLRDVLGATEASVHLVGHSYGCKVMLSAVAAGALPRRVSSALLLQPAISHRSFAVDADGKGHPGGYRSALQSIAEPVMCTFTSHDFALAKTFHLAVRRASDLGEQRIAAGAPSRFAALGGYGPGGMRADEHTTIDIKDPGKAYSELAQPGLEVLALQSSQRIKGHGDILVPAAFWALHEQVRVSSDFA
jgi:pimeloyl-ACP methyl ester carboxylesterase